MRVGLAQGGVAALALSVIQHTTKCYGRVGTTPCQRAGIEKKEFSGEQTVHGIDIGFGQLDDHACSLVSNHVGSTSTVNGFGPSSISSTWKKFFATITRFKQARDAMKTDIESKKKEFEQLETQVKAKLQQRGTLKRPGLYQCNR